MQPNLNRNVKESGDRRLESNEKSIKLCSFLPRASTNKSVSSIQPYCVNNVSISQYKYMPMHHYGYTMLCKYFKDRVCRQINI